MNTFVRYLFMILNIFFLVAGIALVSFGVYLIRGSPIHELMTILQDQVIIYAILILGGIVLILGLMGILGACYEDRCLLNMFISFVILFMLLQIGLVAYGVVEQNSLRGNLEVAWQGLDNETKILLQERLKCCGYNNYTEWSEPYPDSCLNSTITDESVPIKTGCYNSIRNTFADNIVYIGVIAAVALVLQGFQLIVSCLLSKKAGSSTRVQSKAESHTRRMNRRNEPVVYETEYDIDEYARLPIHQTSNPGQNKGMSSLQNYANNNYNNANFILKPHAIPRPSVYGTGG